MLVQSFGFTHDSEGKLTIEMAITEAIGQSRMLCCGRSEAEIADSLIALLKSRGVDVHTDGVATGQNTFVNYTKEARVRETPSVDPARPANHPFTDLYTPSQEQL